MTLSAPAMSSVRQFSVGNLAFTSASRQELVSILLEHLSSSSLDTAPQRAPAANNAGLCIGYINPHVYNLSTELPEVREFINQCDLICLDGLGFCLALKLRQGLFSASAVHRVVALQLFDVFVKSLQTPCSAVLVGVEATDVALSAASITRQNSYIRIRDVMDGFHAAPDYEAFLTEHASVQLVLIGAGTPKSESIALQARRLCPHAVVFHIGAGTIKVYAGTKRRAPTWVSRCGFEWLHRIFFEPHTRERYTTGGWRFFRHILMQSRQDNTKSLP